MSSRYPITKVQDYCFKPLKLMSGGEYIYVPCGKCNGCKLHKANSWSLRVANEIENNPYSLFVTYTYSNEYLPLLKFLRSGDKSLLVPELTYRFAGFDKDGKKILKLREDDISIEVNGDESNIPVTKLNGDYVPYASKRDIQLYFKLLRKDIENEISNSRLPASSSFRYFLVSEYGETFYRPHYHAIIFPSDSQTADFLQSCGLYKNWQMCNCSLFQRHCVYCTSSTAGYLTQYINSSSNLPRIYRESEIKPFRLSSKNPAIGFCNYKKAQVLENVSRGVIEYVKPVPKIGRNYIFCYSAIYTDTLFPKCYGFSRLSYSRLLWIYGLLFRESRRPLVDVKRVASRLRETLNPLDYRATKKCYDVCEELGCPPFHYLYLLDMLYYKRQMFVLKNWYLWQEKVGFSLKLINTYVNWKDYVTSFKSNSLSSLSLKTFAYLCTALNIDAYSEFDLLVSEYDKRIYMQEVDDIIKNMTKMPKFNENYNFSPNSIVTINNEL